MGEEPKGDGSRNFSIVKETRTGHEAENPASYDDDNDDDDGIKKVTTRLNNKRTVTFKRAVPSKRSSM